MLIILYVYFLLLYSDFHLSTTITQCWPPLQVLCLWPQQNLGLGVGPKSYYLVDILYLTLPLLNFVRYLCLYILHNYFHKLSYFSPSTVILHSGKVSVFSDVYEAVLFPFCRGGSGFLESKGEDDPLLHRRSIKRGTQHQKCCLDVF